jgi:hypothetical protein
MRTPVVVDPPVPLPVAVVSIVRLPLYPVTLDA